MITGAARGIVAGMARLLHRRGARLVLIDLDEPGLHGLAKELGNEAVVWRSTERLQRAPPTRGSTNALSTAAK
ncbi:hypothetical protein [Mycolicibacterium frederiksbergense]|uniref:hypothetical protein n=1 Tax=Mycolicibacterium frederiksbergense TaxID=117567 RepID=UPI002474F77E|nr:hypothetical protein [Mycolicibacterium frederiksbergense]